MKRNLLFLMILALAAIAGCKKNKPDEPVAASTPMIKKIDVSQSLLSYSDSFAYDASGRVLERRQSDGFKYVSSYSANSVTVIFYNSSNAVLRTETFFMNAAGRADSSMKVEFGSTTYNIYTYDNEGQLIIKETLNSTHSPATSENYTWENGNLKQSFQRNSSGTIINYTTYTYDLGHDNTIGSRNTGSQLLGTDSKNPVTSNTATNFTVLNTYYYQYLYDNQGRIIKKSNYSDSGTQNSSNTYTYY